MNKTTSNKFNPTSVEKSAAIIVTFTLVFMLGLALAPQKTFANGNGNSNYQSSDKQTATFYDDINKTTFGKDTGKKAVVEDTAKISVKLDTVKQDFDKTKIVETNKSKPTEVKETDIDKSSKVEKDTKEVKDNKDCKKVVEKEDQDGQVSSIKTSAKVGGPAILAATTSTVAPVLPNTGLPYPLMVIASALMSLGSILTGLGLKLRKVSK